jgi:adenylate cyclase
MTGGHGLALVTRYAGGLVSAIVVAVLVFLGVLEPLEHWSLARFFEVRGARLPVAPVVIVSIDESSIVELNQQWPFPRAMHARLLRTIAAAKPLAIGVDIIFDLPSSRGPEDDAALGEVVAQAGNVVLAAVPQIHVSSAFTRVDPNLPLPVIRRSAAGVGAINIIADPDRLVRRAPLRVSAGDELLPSFDVALLRVAARRGPIATPSPALDEVLINFNGPPRTFPWVAYYRVLNGAVPPEFFHDKIVLVGPTSNVMHDVFPTVFATDGTMPGVEIHANVLDTFIRNGRIREIPRAISTIVAVAAALVGAALVLKLHPMRGLATGLLLWFVFTIIAYLGFLNFNAWMRGMAGTVALALGYGVTALQSFVQAQRERRRLSQFFSPEVLREVVRHRDEGSLASSRRMVTVLFSDIRGFTALSEKLPPEDVAEMLRDYLSAMTEIVFDHGGTVDKYIGDCVMALYNVPFEDPDHALKAVRTALDLQERTLEVSDRWEARLGAPLRNGVGINTGEAVVGAMGSRQRLEYTAIGDTVNLASRLEALTKDYGVPILISEYTHQLIQHELHGRELGEVTVKGKTQAVKIFAMLPADLRKHPRAVVEATPTVIVTVGQHTATVRAVDVGEGGMQLAGMPSEWRPGTRLQIRCEGGLLAVPLFAEAVVAWRRGDRAGLAFTGLAADVAPAVAEFVSHRSPR